MNLHFFNIIFNFKQKNRQIIKYLSMAPLVGLEPTTYRLTAERSTN